ncbi:MAG TPA: DUF72 domain-containing protein [Candidatus Saccharimonadales bacterium]|nr:DUF72 domain-containing protein [Candidatus Saccharimonadales bacterium]
MLAPSNNIKALEWKEKRQAKREKQRRENVGRARKMHELRLASQQTTKKDDLLKNETLKPRCYVGCSGWFYWHWRGRFYPGALPTNQWFSHYTTQFKTVELNAPFYSWPTAATVKSWIRQLGRKKFIYTVKVCELITHTKRFRGTKDLVRDFGYIAELLGAHMGCLLFQLPPSFHYTPARLKLIMAQLDPSKRNAVEFRHRSWWKAAVYQAFRKTGTIFCSCSGPKLPDALIKTADDIYVRFHGTTRWYRHDYTDEELAVWADKIKQSGARRVWAYFNNDRDGNAIKNAKRLRKLISQGPA